MMKTTRSSAVRIIRRMGLLALVCGSLAALAGEKSFHELQSAAENGGAAALYSLGKRYSKGDNVPKDEVKAAEFLRRAAEQGLAKAQNDYGAFCAKGIGVAQNFEEAAKWYRKAADQGDALAQFSMGRIAAVGRGVPRDLPEALKWFRKAADQDQPEAIMELGDIYLRGSQGVPVDEVEAFRWFQKAVDLGHVEAHNSLGFLCEHGTGHGWTAEQAVEHYRAAATNGNARGQMNLGRMYLEGIGVATDYVEAYKWFLLARQYGEGSAEKYLRDFETAKILEPSQSDEAKKRAAEFTSARRIAIMQTNPLPATSAGNPEANLKGTDTARPKP